MGKQQKGQGQKNVREREMDMEIELKNGSEWKLKRKYQEMREGSKEGRKEG